MVSQATSKVEHSIRYMISRDIAEVAVIDSLNNTGDGLGEHFFREMLKSRGVVGLVALEHEIVSGYAIYMLTEGVMSVLEFGVHPRFKRRGVGRALLRKLQLKCERQGRTHIEWDVRETDLATQCFLRACGWQATGLAKDPCGDGVDDICFEWWA